MQLQEFWEQVYHRFDPDSPAPDHWRADRPYGPMANFTRALSRRFGNRHYLLIGAIGTGKTTELLRIAEARAAQDVVVFVDLRRHFELVLRDPYALERVQPWEVLLLVGLALVRVLQERLQQPLSDSLRQDLRKAVEALAPPDRVIDLDALVESMPALVGMPGQPGLSPLPARGSWGLPLGMGPAVNDQDSRLQQLLGVVNRLLAAIQESGRALLLVVDGLDRVKGDEAMRGLFTESAALGEFACATVLCGPQLLRRRSMISRLLRFEPLVLANAPVILQKEPSSPGPGVEFLLAVFRRRLADLPAPEGLAEAADCIREEDLRRLAYFSGGQTREFVHMIRMIADFCWDGNNAVASTDAVSTTIDRKRRLLEMGLTADHLRRLAEVQRDPNHELPEDERVAELLDSFYLLVYPNESEWYYPHPLLTIHKLPTG